MTPDRLRQDLLFRLYITKKYFTQGSLRAF